MDIASLNVFIASPGYAIYFEALGVEDPDSPYDFFVIELSIALVK